MSVIKVIEIMANSPVSWEDATKNAVQHAGKSLKGIKSAHVQSQSVVVDKNNITEYRVNLKISFEVLD
jgi:flavin-binding protein dodecin